MTQTIAQRKALARRPRDVTRDSFERMLAAVPEGFRFVKSRVPRSPFVGPFWRDFHFIAEREPAQDNHLKRGDQLVLSCARKVGSR